MCRQKLSNLSDFWLLITRRPDRLGQPLAPSAFHAAHREHALAFEIGDRLFDVGQACFASGSRTTQISKCVSPGHHSNGPKCAKDAA
jgi:hypothetical protein